MPSIGARIERRLERLQDAQWELSENETRYRALLDTQDEAIVRRDEAGQPDVRQQGIPRHVRRQGG